MAHEKSEKVKVKIGKQQIAIFVAIFGLIAVGVAAYFVYLEEFKPVTRTQFEGVPVEFRENLREAQNVPVLPDESALYKQIVKPPREFGPNGQVIIRAPLRNVTIVFVSVSNSTMSWYTVEVAEIVKKLTLLYKGKYEVDVNFAIAEASSYDDLRGTNTAPVIALVHPELAEGTYVSVDDDRNVITISGGDTLKDFDLATVKFLMVALNVTAP